MTASGSRASQTHRSWLTAIQLRRHASPSQETAAKPTPSQKTAAKPTPVDLPGELLEQIFSQLGPRDLIKCSAVNKHWQANVADDRYWQPLATALRLPNIVSKSHQTAVSEFYAADAKEQPAKVHVYSKPPMIAVTQKPGSRYREPTFLHFSPDGSTLATAHQDYTVRLRAAATGKTTAVLKLDKWSFNAVFSSDSRSLGVITDSSTVNVIDVATGTVRFSDRARSVGFSPDGRTCATGPEDGAVQLRDAVTGSVVKTIQHPQFVEGTFTWARHARSMTFSPDSRMLAVTHYNSTVSLISVDTGAIKWALRHNGASQNVAFSPDGRILVTGSSDGSMRRIATDTGSVIETRKFKNGISKFFFSPDGQTLAVSLSDSGTIHLLDSSTGVARAKITQKKHTGAAHSVAFSPDSRTLAIGYRTAFVTTKVDDPGHANLCLADVETGLVRHVITHEHAVDALAFSSDGLTLATGSRGGVMRFIKVATARTLSVAEHKGHVYAATWGQDGSRFASVSGSGAVHLIAFEDRRHRRAAPHGDRGRTAAACLRGAAQATSTQDRGSHGWLKNLLCFRPVLPA